jgi:hypothetical protein
MKEKEKDFSLYIVLFIKINLILSFILYLNNIR